MDVLDDDDDFLYGATANDTPTTGLPILVSLTFPFDQCYS